MHFEVNNNYVLYTFFCYFRYTLINYVDCLLFIAIKKRLMTTRCDVMNQLITKPAIHVVIVRMTHVDDVQEGCHERR